MLICSYRRKRRSIGDGSSPSNRNTRLSAIQPRKSPKALRSAKRSNVATRRKSRSSVKQNAVGALVKQLAEITHIRRRHQPATLKPQLATLATTVPKGERWLHEIKFDGYRILAFFENGRVRLVTRQGHDWTDRFRSLTDAFAILPLRSGILDGEIVSLNEHGISEFQRLQNSLKRGDDGSLVCYLFDVPYCEGFDLTATPLIERKKVLRQLILPDRRKNDGPLRYSDHIAGQGDEILERACRGAMEGIVSKVADGGYQQARTSDWRKVKCLKRQEFVIGGYTQPAGSRIGFGALLLG
jgi:bifunctional non-homologous end joining protein LigD